MANHRRARGPSEVPTVERYDFSAFVVNDANREAFHLCQAAAELRVMPPQPILLVGAEGSGKSHLLHAVDCRVRQGFPDALCVGVSPRNFPDPVGALVDDAHRVRQAPAAILLVDHLERFDEGVDELGALVQLFLDQNCCVILASRARPDELDNLSAGLRAILAGAQVVGLGRSDEARPVQPETEREGQPEETIMAEQIERLENPMAQSEEQGEAVAGKAPGESVPEALRREIAQLRDLLEAAQGDVSRSADEVFTLLRRTEELVDERDAAQEQCAQIREAHEKLTEEFEALCEERKTAAAEAATARPLAQQLQTELDEAIAERHDAESRLEGVAAERDETRGQLAQTTEWLEALRQDHRALAEETEAVHARIQELEQELDAMGTQRDDLQASVDDSIEECIRERGRADQLDRHCQAQAQELEALRRDYWALAEKTEAAHDRIEQLGLELSAVSGQRDDLEARLDEALAEPSQNREQWARLEQEHQKQTEEFHALREAHVAVVAQAHALEMRLPDLENELKEARAVLGDLQGRLDDALTERDRLAADMESVRENDQTVGDLRERLDVLTAENTSLTGEIAPLRRRLRVLANENVRARNTLDRLVPTVKKLMADMARERRQHAKVERGHKAQAAELQWLRQTHQVALSEAKASTEIAEKLQTDLDKAMAQRDRGQARLDGVLAERDELAEAMETLRRTERSLQDELDGTRATQASLQTAVKGLRAAAEREAEQLRTQLETHLEIDEMEERMAETIRERDEARGQAEALRSQLETSRQGLESAAVQLLPDATAPEGEAAPEPVEVLGVKSADSFNWQAFVAACQNRRLGEILCVNGNITQEQLDDALAAQVHTQDRKIGQILIDEGYTTEPDVVRGLAGQVGVPFVRLDDQAVGVDAPELLSGELAKRHCCMPLRVTDEEVTLAMADPLDEVAIDDINRATKLRVSVVATPTADIEAALAKYYGV